MSGFGIEHTYQYLQHSNLDTDAGKLTLATSRDERGEYPYFFTGRLVNPMRVSKLLLGLMHVVRSRFFTPPALLRRILAESDPVVTSNDKRLRFEGFSACCGVYCRLDLLSESLNGRILGRGTTNVDFNQTMMSALSLVTSEDEIKISVGDDGVEFRNRNQEIFEKKVQLPIRWLKGFAEVGVIQSRMTERFSISGPSALRFLNSIPRMKTNKRETWVISSGSSLRLSQVKPRSDGIRVGGLERLRVLERFVSQSNNLKIYSDDISGCSAWELEFDDCRFNLIISPEVWRGFSGEGQLLENLTRGSCDDYVERVKAHLNWDSNIELDVLAKKCDIKKNEVQNALAILGSRGLVGYDLSEDVYFQRHLPFNIDLIDTTQPRLKNAYKIIKDNRVAIKKKDDEMVEAGVQGSDVEHRVVIDGSSSRCTCPWFAKHAVSRGPCRHILAVLLLMDTTTNE